MDNKERSRNSLTSHCATRYDSCAEQENIFVDSQNDLSCGSRYHGTPPSAPVHFHGKLLIMFYLIRAEVANRNFCAPPNHLLKPPDPLWFNISITSPTVTAVLLHFEKLVFRAVTDGARVRRLALDSVAAYGAYVEFCFRQIATGSHGIQRL